MQLDDLTLKLKHSSVYIVANYNDTFFDQTCNDEAYAFWRKKVCERISDPVKRELLAPEVQPYPIGCKNPSLEENFYEVCDRDNIEIVDIKATPILEVTPTSVKTSAKEIDLDILVFATGALGAIVRWHPRITELGSF